VEAVYKARDHFGEHDAAAAVLSEAVASARVVALAGTDSTRAVPSKESFAEEASRVRAALAGLPIPERGAPRYDTLSTIHTRCQSILSKLDAAAAETDDATRRQRAGELLADIESDRVASRPRLRAHPTVLSYPDTEEVR
jgi:hypothetical protein